MTPAVINTSGKGNVDKGAPLRSLRLPEELHPCFVGESITFPCIAGNAGTDDIFPSGLAATIARENMIDIEFRTIEVNSTILTGVLVTLENIMPSELDFFFGKPVEKAENDDSGNPDFQRDALKHPWFRIGDGKMSPTGKIMGQKIARSIRCYNLGMPLIEEGKCTPCGTSVNGLPQPVEYKNRLVELGIHDLVVSTYGVASRAFRFLSTMQV